MDKICQSCAMPIKEENQKGTNEDGSKNEDYCIYCFKEGKFTSDMSLEEYVEKQVNIAVEKMNVPEDKAREMANKILPSLKRWRD